MGAPICTDSSPFSAGVLQNLTRYRIGKQKSAKRCAQYNGRMYFIVTARLVRPHAAEFYRRLTGGSLANQRPGRRGP